MADRDSSPSNHELSGEAMADRSSTEVVGPAEDARMSAQAAKTRTPAARTPRPRHRRVEPTGRRPGSSGGRRDTPQITDLDLVVRAQGGDRSAFDLLVLRYMGRIYNLCYSKLGNAEDASDATQEVFLRAYKALPRFEAKSQFYTWLFRVAINCAYTGRKQRQRRRRLQGGSIDQPTSDDNETGREPTDGRDGPAVLNLRAEKRRIIHEAIATLPEDFQRIVMLRDIEGLSYDEIAEILKLPVGSVKSRLHRARVKLRDKLRPYVK
jgi:RNA polymerase sigma-70 factor (ECF subfamily)